MPRKLVILGGALAVGAVLAGRAVQKRKASEQTEQPPANVYVGRSTDHSEYGSAVDEVI